MVIFRRRVRVLHSDRAMDVADPCAARIGGGAAAGSAGGDAVGIADAGIVAGSEVFALGRQSIWRSGGGAGCGARDLVGAAFGLAGEDSRSDRANAAGILLVCGAAELRGDAVRRSTRGLSEDERNSAQSTQRARAEKDARTARIGWPPKSGFCGGGGFQDALVVALVLGDYVVGAEFFLGVDAGALAHFAATIGARQNLDGVASCFLDVARLH